MKLLPLTLLLLTPYATAQEVLDVCIDYNCDKRATVELQTDEWRVILQPFDPAATNAQQERQQIRESIALFEQVVGKHTPNHKDQAKNQGEDEIGQLDCIAESTNAQHYLQWLARKEKLKWHQVDERVKRSPFIFDVHWGVKITEQATQNEYIVDSWYGANGDMPDIEPLSQWLKQ